MDRNRLRRADLPRRSGLLGLSLLMLLASGCGSVDNRENGEAFSGKNGQAEVSDKDGFPLGDDGEQTQILLDGGSITAEGYGADSVKVAGSRMTITREGTYLVSGVLEEGQLQVDAGGDDRVTLILAGVDITNTGDASLYVKNAGHTELILARGTENFISSGEKETCENLEENGDFINSVDEDSVREAQGAAVYAKDDLSITGTGSLKVVGGINNGIHTSNHLIIEEGIIEVRALNHAIKGKDSVTIEGGSFTLFSGGDGIRSDETEGAGCGVVDISGGSFVIQSGKNGVRARTALTISGGSLEVVRSYEGLEANQLTISGGRIDITAEDDGINANGEPVEEEQDAADAEMGEKRAERKAETQPDRSLPNLIISGGEIHVDARGDGLDSNGNILIEGGTTVIDGPKSDKDGPLDYGYENGGICLVNGGTILAVGSSGMAETFGEDSGQCSFRHIFDSSYNKGTEISISDQEGKVLFRYSALKKGASVVFSSPELVVGKAYILEAGDEKVIISMDGISVSSGKKPFR